MRPTARLLLLLALAGVAVAPRPGAAEEKESPAPLWRRCYTAVDWFHAAEVPDSEARMIDLVSTGQMAAWSERWIQKAISSAPSLDDVLQEAKRRKTLVFWYVPAVEGQHVILPHLLDRYVMTGPLSDPDVTNLLNRRFVCLKLPAGGALAQKHGLSAPSFVQPGFLVLRPDGSVAYRTDRIYTFQPAWWDSLLRGIARREKAAESEKLTRSRAQHRDNPTRQYHLNLLGELFADGQVREARLEAEATLAELVDLDLLPPGAKPPPDWVGPYQLLRMRACLRARDGARVLLDQANLPSAFMVQRLARVLAGRALLGRGKPALAESMLRPVVTPTISFERGERAEAGFHLGLALYLQGKEKEARDTWRMIARENSSSPWAHKAAACCEPGTDGRLGEAALVRGMDSPIWSHASAYPTTDELDDATITSLPRDSQWRRAPADADDIAERAVAFLLDQQRSDGSWPGFRWGGGSKKEREDKVDPGAGHNRNIDVAIAAACAMALQRHYALDPEAIETALKRADRYLIPNRVLGIPLEKDRSAKVARGPDDACWVYADAYRIRYLTQRLYSYEPQQRALARDLMQSWIKRLRKHQVTHEGDIPHYSYRSTFSTAAMITCMHEAVATGLKVPKAMFEDAGKALAATRAPGGGLYGYRSDMPRVTRNRLGAANRQPLITWAQWRNGVVEATEIPKALDTFLEAYDDSAALARKTNFHVPQLGHTAGYYFFHNFHAACIAARDAYPHGTKYMKRLLALLCELPEADGTFIDSGFSYGKCYSTAMALQSLHLLTTPLPPR